MELVSCIMLLLLSICNEFGWSSTSDISICGMPRYKFSFKDSSSHQFVLNSLTHVGSTKWSCYIRCNFQSLLGIFLCILCDETIFSYGWVHMWGSPNDLVPSIIISIAFPVFFFMHSVWQNYFKFWLSTHGTHQMISFLSLSGIFYAFYVTELFLVLGEQL
jgi:hypothetical protein